MKTRRLLQVLIVALAWVCLPEASGEETAGTLSRQFQHPGLPSDWRGPFVKTRTGPYRLNGTVYDASVDVDCVEIYNHGPDDHATNQQPCVAMSSDGTMVITWTQASVESAKDQSVLSSTSHDGGRTWMEAVDIERAVDRRPGSWAMVFCVPHTGRFYVFYWWDENQNTKRDAGIICFRYSDDKGASWSRRYPIPMPRHDLDVEGQDSHGWTTGFPLLLPDGAMLMGFTKMGPGLGAVAAKRMGTRPGPQHWRCEVFFLRAENILTQSDPEKLEFTVTPKGPDGLWVSDEEDPKVWEGDWKTEQWGKLYLFQEGNKVTGEYEHDNGKLVGAVSGGTLTGTWSEAPSYSPPDDAGDVELTMAPGGNSFTGRWRYGSSGDWDGTWNGVRIR